MKNSRKIFIGGLAVGGICFGLGTTTGICCTNKPPQTQQGAADYSFIRLPSGLVGTDMVKINTGTFKSSRKLG